MVEQVRPAEFGAWLARHAGARPLLLDVREAMEVAIARVPVEGFEFLHIPMHQVPQRLAEIDPDRPVACLCHHGVRSQQVAYFLADRGYEQVANVAGGIDAWSVQADPAIPRY